ncbi:Xaa-Pro aminopeptidase [Deinobacterium chartae]|uniref:Xaa-Pro aminopeptidase n=1 Tax=Deinobacterium chartae TaxID=521158 RepID=A0A841I3I5_9DEIO|nr:Xaa-Pro peptidase family protein [Deinobacterium chartae]MBB6098582.1 Xaa-Pro aminopeptidase [Deinobacterium chartae]
MSALTGIPAEETRARARGLMERLGGEVDAVVLFDDQYIQYYTAFAFIPTERPVALLIGADGERTLLVPRLEFEHARNHGHAETVESYREFPDARHPLLQFGDLLEARGLGAARIGIDQDGYPNVMGYWGPALSEVVPGAQLRRITRTVDRQMAIKSDLEVRIIRESCRWGARAHELLQAYTRPGVTETEVENRATAEATAEMTAALAPHYRGKNRWIQGALALYRGQIGRNGALPHALNVNAVFQAGDTLVTGAGAGLWGYLSELERTMFIGEPGPQQRRYFDLMMGAQDLAFSLLQPGARCSEVDGAVREYYRSNGLEGHWRHHTGHGLGQRIHESPFLDIGDDTVLEAGMVLSVEPGIYDADWGGFRHSDTVLITESGMERLTLYPRELEALILPA